MARTVVTGLLICLLGLPGFPAQADRILRFPTDRSLGWLSAHDAPAQIDGLSFLTGQFRAGGKSLGLAQGDVVVPDGKLVWLALDIALWHDPDRLAALRALDPDDLFALSTDASRFGVLKPNDRCMPHIAHLTGLRVLDMWTTNITDKGAEYLGNLTRLQWLIFGGRISHSGLSSVGAMSSLRGLVFSSSERIDQALSALGRQHALETLSLDGKTVSGDDLPSRENFPALPHLGLRGAFTEAALVHLEAVPQLQTLLLDTEGPISEIVAAQLGGLGQLKKLRIRSELGDQACAHLARLKQLEDLKLAYKNAIGDAGMSHLAGLVSLTNLSLGRVTLSDQGFGSLARLRNLESLFVHVPELTEPGLRHLASMRNLRELTLGIETISSHDYTLADALHSLDQLEELSVHRPIREEDITAMADLAGLRHVSVQLAPGATNKVFSELARLHALRYLSIDGKAQVSIGGLRHLHDLSQLESLYLRGLRRDESVMDISGLTSLETLCIQMHSERDGKDRRYDRFKDEDLACLEGLTTLERLQLSSPGVGDRGVAYLTKLKNLNYFFASDSSITDEGLHHLSRLDSLSRMTIHGGEFTDEGIACLEDLKRLAVLELTSNRAISGQVICDLQEELPLLTSITIDSPQLRME